MPSRVRPVWPDKERKKILKQFDKARNRKHPLRGMLGALCRKFGITRQHEWAWRRDEARQFDVALDNAKGVEL